MTIRKINRNQVAAKELPSRFFRELVSHRVLKSKGIALRVVDVLPAKQAGPRHPHSHPGMEEVIYVENGSGKAWVNGETAKIGRGDTILIPAGARHMMINTGRGPLKLFCAFSAADPENHYKEYPDISYAE
ncbi:MAG: cupin domain-containing protein [Deltaproteobacteria bacterium]|nr:MAG: cupin domain-containing protein [Deltaproteobacteria bacterium]